MTPEHPLPASCANLTDKMPMRTRSCGRKSSASDSSTTMNATQTGGGLAPSPTQRREKGVSRRQKSGHIATNSGKVQRKKLDGKRAKNQRQKETSYEFTGFDAPTKAAPAAGTPLRARTKRSIASITPATPVFIPDPPKRRRISPSSTDDHGIDASSTARTSTVPPSTAKNFVPAILGQPASSAGPQTPTDSERPATRSNDSPLALPPRRSGRLRKPDSSVSCAPFPPLPQTKNKRMCVSKPTPALFELGITNNSIADRNDQDRLHDVAMPVNSKNEEIVAPNIEQKSGTSQRDYVALNVFASPGKNANITASTQTKPNIVGAFPSSDIQSTVAVAAQSPERLPNAKADNNEGELALELQTRDAVSSCIHEATGDHMGSPTDTSSVGKKDDHNQTESPTSKSTLNWIPESARDLLISAGTTSDEPTDLLSLALSSAPETACAVQSTVSLVFSNIAPQKGISDGPLEGERETTKNPIAAVGVASLTPRDGLDRNSDSSNRLQKETTTNVSSQLGTIISASQLAATNDTQPLKQAINENSFLRTDSRFTNDEPEAKQVTTVEAAPQKRIRMDSQLPGNTDSLTLVRGTPEQMRSDFSRERDANSVAWGDALTTSLEEGSENTFLTRAHSTVVSGLGKVSEKCTPESKPDADAKELRTETKFSKGPPFHESPERTRPMKPAYEAPSSHNGNKQQIPFVGIKNLGEKTCQKIALPPANGSIIKNRVNMLKENGSKASREATTQKRVRFQEPSQPLRTSRKNVRLMHLVRRRQERLSRRSSPKDLEDVCVVPPKLSGPNREIDQVLLDDLQYLLDGVFKYDASSKLNYNPVLSSIQALVPLLRKGCHDTGREELPSIEGVLTKDEASVTDGEGYLSDVMEMLILQPKLLKKIVTHFFKLLGNGPMINAHVALVLIIIFRSTGSMILITESEFKSLVNTFVQSSLTILTLEANPRHVNNQAEGRYDKSFADHAEDGKDDRSAIETLNRLTREAGVAFDGSATGISTFRKSTDAATYLVGSTIAVLLSKVPEVRRWMRETHHLGRIVAALYGSEAIMKKRLKQVNAEGNLKLGASWKVATGSMLKLLECAALDETCQSRIVLQTKVIPVAVRTVYCLRKENNGGLDSEWVLCNALKACINLTRGCRDGATKFANAEGVRVTLDCLVEECTAAGLMGALESQHGDPLAVNRYDQNCVADSEFEIVESTKSGTCEESFDIRVLCLVLLANVAAEEHKVKESFSEIKAKSVANVTGGALGVAVEIMKRCSAVKDMEGPDDSGSRTIDVNFTDGDGVSAEALVRDRMEWTGSNMSCVGIDDVGNQNENSKNSSRGMERKITIGYACLLIGVLVWQCDKNRMILEAMLPQNGLQQLAGVLQECLSFHQDVGVNCASLDGVYTQIIHALAHGASTSNPTISADPSYDCNAIDREDTGDVMDSRPVNNLDSDAANTTSTEMIESADAG